MKKRKLGNSGLEVSPLAFGGNVFGWTADDATSFKLLDAFVGAGFNLVDTADYYSRWVSGHQGGESEAVIGRWLARGGKREQVIIATKVGRDLGDGRKGLAKSYILRAVDASLKRLQTDYIDLYQSHCEDPDTPVEETLDAFAELMRAGKLRAIGASNHSAAKLREALETAESCGLPGYQTLQPLYNLCERDDYETTLEPLCREKDLGVIPYYALASGFLTGKYRSQEDLAQSVRGHTVKKYLNTKGLRILAALDQVAADERATPAQVALAWLMARPSITAPIASATSVEQLQELMTAARLELSRASIELLTRASA